MKQSTQQAPRPKQPRGNAVLALSLFGVIAGMVGLSFAAVPLYRAFCAATGYGGTPKIGPAASPGVIAQTIAVRFNADTNPTLPWRFLPEQNEVHVKLGDEQVAFYHARNLDSGPVTGVATYNVTPEKAAKYFHKTACFCFNEQTLAPNQEMQFPLSFWVDPAIASDPSTADVNTITLSYTFFRSLDDAARSGALAKAGPHVGPLVR
ncbi:cytochrome c oxidase assembly protein [Limobrevibacterium gyesilva]|uniref:Cytochrome c oxidase assembly protein CtaG n=1 Tax=Limobrevibacterium gyesilva TaxID=2991712 RepID=A0AA42CD70_9PROT|nr:cytochrome c oxidase assembly protein [Limobrevibacterium gyesilva]MCW3473359.1 cytochrome c oxidase assembly protein [Limobrevibacterium gyesilva]